MNKLESCCFQSESSPNNARSTHPPPHSERGDSLHALREAGLSFTRAVRTGDVYTCSRCRSNTIHLSIGKNGTACGVRAMLQSGHFGSLRACETKEAKGE